jgi:hypothetical protein
VAGVPPPFEVAVAHNRSRLAEGGAVGCDGAL